MLVRREVYKIKKSTGNAYEGRSISNVIVVTDITQYFLLFLYWLSSNYSPLTDTRNFNRFIQVLNAFL